MYLAFWFTVSNAQFAVIRLNARILRLAQKNKLWIELQKFFCLTEGQDTGWQWRSQRKILERAKHLILGEQHYFVWDAASQSTKWLDMAKIGGAWPLATPMQVGKPYCRTGEKYFLADFWRQCCGCTFHGKEYVPRQNSLQKGHHFYILPQHYRAHLSLRCLFKDYSSFALISKLPLPWFPFSWKKKRLPLPWKLSLPWNQPPLMNRPIFMLFSRPGAVR